MMKYLCEDEAWKDMRGMLVTQDAHGLYEKYDFASAEKIFMTKR